MKRLIYLLSMLLTISIGANSQTLIERSDGTFTQGDTYLAALKSLIIPYGEIPSLNGGLDQPSIFFNTSTQKLVVWNGTDWEDVGKDTDLSGYYTKVQVDALLEAYTTVDSLNTALALKVDKTTTVNGKALTGNITINTEDIPGLVVALEGKVGLEQLTTILEDYTTDTQVENLIDSAIQEIEYPVTSVNSQQGIVVLSSDDIESDAVGLGSTITDALNSLNTGKANTNHTHTISQITNLQDSLSSKQDILTAGENIDITNGVISATGGGGGGELSQLQLVEGSGSDTGWRLLGQSAFKGVPGANSVDLSIANNGTRGATGGYSAIGGGNDNLASGSNSTVGGGGFNLASGSNSTVGGGNSNEASGNYSTVGGGSTNTASGIASTVGGGVSNVANEFSSFVIGRFSLGGAAQSSWVEGSPIFKVGNGTYEFNRSNAYTLYNDGRSEQIKDVEVTEIGQGFVTKSPDGTRWRITVDNSGNLTATSL